MQLNDYKETVYTVPTTGNTTLKVTAENNTAFDYRAVTIADLWEGGEIVANLDKESAQLLADIFTDIANSLEG